MQKLITVLILFVFCMWKLIEVIRSADGTGPLRLPFVGDANVVSRTAGSPRHLCWHLLCLPGDLWWLPLENDEPLQRWTHRNQRMKINDDRMRSHHSCTYLPLMSSQLCINYPQARNPTLWQPSTVAIHAYTHTQFHWCENSMNINYWSVQLQQLHSFLVSLFWFFETK